MAPFVLHLSGPGWKEAAPSDGPRCWLKGHIYLNGTPIGVNNLVRHLGSAPSSPQSLTANLTRLNGFYAWVTQSEQELRAGVDHIRSRPIFYGQAEGRFFLSDDAEWVRQQVGDREMDPIAREEFQLTGYVTGADTLFPHVKQLQAGECLVAKADEGVLIRIETQRYYRFLHIMPARYDKTALGAELDRVAVASVQRLIDYAGGRQILVPLSGGYDSRLIVILLKRLGYDNVLTFTYGVPGNQESAYSKRVADALGLRWHFVEYSEALWREAWQTPERWAYQKWASGWTSIAHVQDWLAVKVMKAQGVSEPDCLFVPGHSGDFVAGSHIPTNAFESSSFTLADATDAVFSKHYGLAPLKFFDTSRQAWEERIRGRMERDGIVTAWEYADVFEKWDWQERQAKFICNSVRVYEFFGYDWWMPYWDLEFVRYWEHMPLSMRKKRRFYAKYVGSLLASVTRNKRLEFENASNRYAIFSELINSNAFITLKSISLLKTMVWLFRRSHGWHSDLAIEGCYGQQRYAGYIAKGFTLNGALANTFVEEVAVGSDLKINESTDNSGGLASNFDGRPKIFL